MQASNVLAQLATPSQQDSAKKRGELGQDDFMRLLVTQLENQDPTNPMDNFEFLS
ncbi:MAG TPA: flagellar biosynthesis protein FlgD, partial [Porticoccaceae bacterium]|nr:flagellar biosynthesis protein FlgD [Porticoccaceae bacterium]